MDRVARIRQLNDALRTTFRGGRVMITAGVKALPRKVQLDVLIAVQTFGTFTEENDPHREHDFGNFEFAGGKFFWKIDYYDEQCEYGSKDPIE